MAVKRIPTKQKQDDTTNIYAIQFKPTAKNKPTRKGGQPLINGDPVKIGITDRHDVKPRLLEIERDSGMKGRVLHFQKNVKNGYDLEQKIHNDFKNDKVYFQYPFSGYNEFVDTHRVADIISTIQKPIGSHGTISPQYNEDYMPANPIRLLLCFIMPFALYFLTLYFRK